MLLGGGFTMIADDLARTVLPGEIPLGILTSAIGASLFIYLMISIGFKVKKHE
jgi:iron complex transport system permease protein